LQTLLPPLLLLLQQFGYPALWFFIFLAAAGLPLPVGLVVTSAGAFAALGRFNVFALIFIVISAATCGDAVGYWLGRRGGVYLSGWIKRHPRNRILPQQTFERSHRYFQRHGGWAIFITRFLLSGLGGSVNLLAGLELYPYARFFWPDLLGNIISALIAIPLGFFFGSNWQHVADLLSTFSLLVTVLLCVTLGIYIAFKFLRRYDLLPAFSLVRREQPQALLTLEAGGPDGGGLAPSVCVKRIHKKDKFYTSLYIFASLWRKNESEGLE
jgi:membrane-associated protein